MSSSRRPRLLCPTIPPRTQSDIDEEEEEGKLEWIIKVYLKRGVGVGVEMADFEYRCL